MSGESLAEALETGLSGLAGVDLGAAQQSMLLSYLALLERWNRAYNLTAVKNPKDMISRHLLDSLSVAPYINGTRLLDAGTGAGLPGIPLAIAQPGLEVTLLDSSGKKVRFLNHVRRQLGLENIHPVQKRLESFSTSAPFDGIVSRAFSDLATFARAARHLAPVSARLLAMKGRHPDRELRELPDWVRVESVEKLTVPGLQEDRHLVIMSVSA
ncbi:MAG: 16S rRNA (guanine(527)-N(7))-methyltransferase RsmG [Xanthomonadales bacterium]|nr:16S rRNA (guanine(527)-N(7))-methyltransferase RsmG [Xanthomonadales bacterium]